MAVERVVYSLNRTVLTGIIAIGVFLPIWNGSSNCINVFKESEFWVKKTKTKNLLKIIWM